MNISDTEILDINIVNDSKEKIKSNAIIKIKEKVKEKKIFKIFKRGFDVISSLCGILLLSPIFLIISIAIKIDSKGKVFFKHKRVGKNGKEIYIL